MANRTIDPIDWSDAAMQSMDLSIKRLRWAKDPTLDPIINDLVRCRDTNTYSCGSLGCRLCRERAQGTFAASVSKGFRGRCQVDSWTFVPSDGWVAYDEIDTFDLKAFVRRHRAKLKRVLPHHSRVAGGVDFSLNVFQNDERWWQAHIHFLVPTQFDCETEKLLRKRYPIETDLAIFWPVLKKTIQAADFTTNSAYSLKSYHTKRSIFIAEPESGRCGYRSSEGQRLPADADEMLQLALSKYRVSDALFLVGLKRKRSSDPATVKLMRTDSG